MEWWKNIGLLRVGVIVVSLAIHSQADETNDLSHALAIWHEHLSGVTSVSSRFVQEKKMALFKEPLRMEGKMTADHAGHFAWEIFSPMRYKLLVNGDQISQWDEETGRVQVLSRRKNPVVDVIYEQMSAWMSGSISTLTNSYSARLISSKPMAFEFIPLESTAMRSYIQKIVLRLRDDKQYLSHIEIVDGSGDETSISFVDTQLNTTIDPAFWTNPRP
jgi:outer membrane lipoprotein-sorting protein